MRIIVGWLVDWFHDMPILARLFDAKVKNFLNH